MQKTVYFKERTVRGSEIVEPGIPVSLDSDQADALLEDGLAATEPPEVVETHVTYDTMEVPVARPVEEVSHYDHLVSGVQGEDIDRRMELGFNPEEADHTATDPPVITGQAVAHPEAAATEGAAPTSTRTGTRRLPPEPEALVQLLTGKSLNFALKSRGLPVGTDSANEKRVRLLSDFREKGDVEAGLKPVVEKALEDA